MKFNWDGLNEDIFNKYQKGGYSYGEFVGCVRVGNIAFDITTDIEDASNDIILLFDCYVGGVDTGYGYSNNNYPYDYFDGGMFEGISQLMNYNEFRLKVEKILENYITYYGKNYTHANLLEKANAELNIW